MKLKQFLEDFKVFEVNDIEILKEKADYRLYLVEKKGIETFALLSYLSRKNNIPKNDLGIAGLKDKYAVTAQYLTIPSKYEIKTLKESNLNIKFLGYVNEKISIGDLISNRFEITVRDLDISDLGKIKQRSKEIVHGVPNYFDSQRFGSVIHKKFIAEYVIKNDYEQAVKIYLTEFTKSEKSEIKQEKRLILQNWKNLDKIKVRSGKLKNILEEYKKTKDWKKAYNRINPELRDMFFAAYQSYLWNECLKSAIIKTLPKNSIYNVQYNIGSLIFFKSIDAKTIEKTKEFFQKLLSEKKVEKFDRDILVKPADFKISEPSIDEANDKGRNKKFKVTLFFTLPKGSYATMITKKIFGR
jgi:tRNA pseudouridine13 synthase